MSTIRDGYRISIVTGRSDGAGNEHLLTSGNRLPTIRAPGPDCSVYKYRRGADPIVMC